MKRTQTEIDKVARHFHIIGLDAGARGGIVSDLELLAPATTMIGFEPDREEHERLRARANDTWHAVQYVQAAVGPSDGEEFHLNLYRQRGCSSLLEANHAQAERFSRAEWFTLDASVPLTTYTLDTLAAEHGFTNADFMKIDIQGFELQALLGAPALLDNLSALRLEVGFRELYKGQPLYEDLASFLRERGFFPACILDTHNWRRTGQAGVAPTKPGTPRFSHGELMHADVIFLRDEDRFGKGVRDVHEHRLQAALTGAALGFLDYAKDLIADPHTSALFGEVGIEPMLLLEALSVLHQRRQNRQTIQQLKKQLRGLLRSLYAA